MSDNTRTILALLILSLTFFLLSATTTQLWSVTSGTIIPAPGVHTFQLPYCSATLLENAASGSMCYSVATGQIVTKDLIGMAAQ